MRKDDSRLVCIKTYADRFRAEMEKGMLSEAGIEAIIIDRDQTGHDTPFSSVQMQIRLIVFEEDAPAAQEILSKLSH